MGSVTIAGWIAHGAFCVMLLRVWIERRPRTALIFVALWLAGYFGLPFILYGELYFMPYVAVLDIAMLLMVWNEGDTRLGLRE
jgi:hypothetical protein